MPASRARTACAKKNHTDHADSLDHIPLRHLLGFTAVVITIQRDYLPAKALHPARSITPLGVERKAPTSVLTRSGDTVYASGFPPFDPTPETSSRAPRPSGRPGWYWSR